MQVGVRKHTTLAQNWGCTVPKHTMLVETVCKNYKGYTKNNILRAKQARWAQAMMVNPSKKDYKGLVSNHLISNCPVTHADVTKARKYSGQIFQACEGEWCNRCQHQW